MSQTRATGARARIGRPPAGAREGEKVKDYPQLGIRLPGEVRAKLQALSIVTARPQWCLISDAIECHLRDRPDSERTLVHELVKRSRGRALPRERRQSKG